MNSDIKIILLVIVAPVLLVVILVTILNFLWYWRTKARQIEKDIRNHPIKNAALEQAVLYRIDEGSEIDESRRYYTKTSSGKLVVLDTMISLTDVNGALVFSNPTSIIELERTIIRNEMGDVIINLPNGNHIQVWAWKTSKNKFRKLLSEATNQPLMEPDLNR